MIQTASSPDAEHLSKHWFPGGVVAVHPVATGTNNQTFRIITSDSQFIMRVAFDPDAESRILREIRLLNAVQRLNLPFLTPHPLPLPGGEPFLHLPDRKNPVVVTMFDVISGSSIERGDTELTRQAGMALGILDTRLKEISLDTAEPLITPDELRAFRIAPDPAFSQLDLPATIHLLGDVANRWEEYRHLLPTQVIHADYYPANILAHHGELTGIIDFEYALAGPQVLDLAIGLWTFGTEETSFNWSAIETFATGYATTSLLSAEEVAAIPMLIVLREAGSLVHWSARFDQGLITTSNLAWRVDRLHQVHASMERQGAKLTGSVIRAMQDHA